MEVVRELLQNLPETRIVANEGPGTWTPFDVVGHLIHGERADWIPRVEHILQHGDSVPGVRPGSDVCRVAGAFAHRVARHVPTATNAELESPVISRHGSTTPAGRLLTLLAALSQTSAFSVGGYCEDETRCHRSVLRALLEEHGARIE